MGSACGCSLPACVGTMAQPTPNAYTLSMRCVQTLHTLKDLHLLKAATRSDSIYRDHML